MFTRFQIIVSGFKPMFIHCTTIYVCIIELFLENYVHVLTREHFLIYETFSKSVNNFSKFMNSFLCVSTC
jgi:hypothetical protein